MHLKYQPHVRDPEKLPFPIDYCVHDYYHLKSVCQVVRVPRPFYPLWDLAVK